MLKKSGKRASKKFFVWKGIYYKGIVLIRKIQQVYRLVWNKDQAMESIKVQHLEEIKLLRKSLNDAMDAYIAILEDNDSSVET